MPVDTYSNSYEDIAPQWQKCRDAYQGQEALRQNGTYNVGCILMQLQGQFKVCLVLVFVGRQLL